MDIAEIVKQIDEQISRLQQAKSILSGVAVSGSRTVEVRTTVTPKRKPGRPSKTTPIATPAKSQKHRTIRSVTA